MHPSTFVLVGVAILLALFDLLFLFILVASLASYAVTRVPYAPSKSNDIEYLVKTLPIKPGQSFADIGSGNGRVVFIVERLSGARVTGYELSMWTHLRSKLRRYLTGSNAELLRKNFFKADWSGHDIVYGYLFPPVMQRVEDKFLAECKPGTIAVMRDFPLPHQAPLQVYKPYGSTLYIYRHG